VYPPLNWEVCERDVYFCQNIANCNGDGPTQFDRFAPSFFFGARGNNHKMIHYTGEPCEKETRVGPGIILDTTLIPGSWIRVVSRATWKSDSTGRLELWLNGTRVQDITGPNTFPDTRPMNFKSGLYIPSWREDSFGATAQKRAWFDHYRIGDTYAEVNPTSW